jgi:hypothetical protein
MFRNVTPPDTRQNPLEFPKERAMIRNFELEVTGIFVDHVRDVQVKGVTHP